MKKFIAFLLMAMMAVSLIACGKSKDTETDTSENVSEENTNEQNETEPSEDTEEAKDNTDETPLETLPEDFVLDVKDDDHTVVFTIANTVQVYTHDGTSVTGYTTYVDAGDKEAAQTLLEIALLREDNYEEEGIKKVELKGNYLVTEYLEKAFPYTTYEELHAAAEMLQLLEQK